MKTIKIEQLLKIHNPIILDIRYTCDYNNGYIPSAINIPYYCLKRNHRHYLNHTDIYYLYCDYGDKSREICNYLQGKDYNTINIKGGYNSYKKYLNNKKNHF